ncbi:ABC transporter substrate-binding protein [Deinococcus frigens]|uniref:ABC transporter substrate-binding protein n=1 Tax=Deinococcus frigens TaxID=249403 RepID=UPI0004982927|nr:ABC transporter substrate-binding protein [Deinococcus frigens]
MNKVLMSVMTGALTLAAGTSSPALAATGPAKYSVTVTLNKNIKWSDGTPLTAQDFVGGYDMIWAQGYGIWNQLTDVRAKDSQTIEFLLTDFSPTILRQLVRSNQTGSWSQYGPLYTQARKLRLDGAKTDSAEVKTLLNDLEKYKPNTTVSYGPYYLTAGKVNPTQLELVKNLGGFNASKIGFDRVVVYYGETQQVLPLLLSGQIDYSVAAFTPTDVKAIERNPDLNLIRSPLSVGPALWFNQNLKPFDRKEFRQAVAYVINRQDTAQIALGTAGKPIKYMAGFSDLLVPGWLNAATRNGLNEYKTDATKAAALLTGIGFKKQGNTWVDNTGKPVKFEITAPADFVDFLAAAQAVSQQLNSFGFQTTVRSISAQERPTTIDQARYQALMDFGLISTPSHPSTSYGYYMTEGFFGSNKPDATSGSKGMNWPLTQKTKAGATVNIRALIQQSLAGDDLAAQKTRVQTLAQIFNDQLPVIPIFERYTTDPINTKARVTGWLPFTNAVYKNNQGSDNYVAIQFLNGTLKPIAGSDKSFRTALPYQQQDYSFNFFTGNSLQQTFSSPVYHMSFPPLMWYSEAQQKYIPAVAQKYTVTELK